MTAGIAVFVVGTPAFCAALGRVVEAADGLVAAGVVRGTEPISLTGEADPVVLLDSGDSPDPALPDLVRILDAAERARVLVVCRPGLRPGDAALFHGVRGLLNNDVLPQHLSAAVHLVDQACGPLLLVPPQHRPEPSRPELTAREREVMHWLGQALTNGQIANRLGISEGTVKRHVYSIFTKLGAVSRVDAVNKYANGPLTVGGGR